MSEHADATRAAFDLRDVASARDLAAIAETVVYEADERILEAGEPAAYVMLVLGGEVEVYLPFALAGAERGIQIDRVDGGALLGWSSLVDPSSYMLSAWSATQVEALRFAAEELFAWATRNPTEGLRTYRAIANAAAHRLRGFSLALQGEIEHSTRLKRRDAYE